jgi:hypothetical protein
MKFEDVCLLTTWPSSVRRNVSKVTGLLTDCCDNARVSDSNHVLVEHIANFLSLNCDLPPALLFLFSELDRAVSSKFSRRSDDKDAAAKRCSIMNSQCVPPLHCRPRRFLDFNFLRQPTTRHVSRWAVFELLSPLCRAERSCPYLDSLLRRLDRAIFLHGRAEVRYRVTELLYIGLAPSIMNQHITHYGFSRRSLPEIIPLSNLCHFLLYVWCL